MVGELTWSRVAEHRGGSDHDRGVGGPQAHARQEHSDVFLVLEVDERVRQLRPHRERPQRHRLGGEPGADDAQRLGAAARGESSPARDEPAEDGVREVGLGAHQATEIGGRDGEHAPGPDDARGQVDPLAGEQVELAEEAPRGVDDEQLLTFALGPDDLDGTLEDHEKVVARVARAEEDVAHLDFALGTELGERGELGG
jgi:hypothetical protein